MNLIYFAYIRESIGKSSETITLPDDVGTVSDLLRYLESKGENYKTAFAQSDLVRVAVNEEYVSLDRKITSSDEIAIFPPMTGG